MANFFHKIGDDIKKYMNEMDEEMSPEEAKKKDEDALAQTIDQIMADASLDALNDQEKENLKRLLGNQLSKIVDQSFQDGFSCGYMNGSMVQNEEGFE
ncbi:hypothetical protein C815_01923 [Firmicutes bacterium M10-2]|nr:hypothetical protein C815_01923 [Firmicutes bacterium M10-2]